MSSKFSLRRELSIIEALKKGTLTEFEVSETFKMILCIFELKTYQG